MQYASIWFVRRLVRSLDRHGLNPWISFSRIL